MAQKLAKVLKQHIGRIAQLSINHKLQISAMLMRPIIQNHKLPQLKMILSWRRNPSATYHIPDTWSLPMALSVPIYRHLLSSSRSSIKTMRAIVAIGNYMNKIPENVKIVSWKLESPHPSAIVNGIQPDKGLAIPVEWVIAPSAVSKNIDQDPVILYFHGGGYFLSDAEGHRSLTWQLSEASGLPVLSVSYRLAPENTFPAQLQDAITSYLYLRNKNQTRSIIIAGDSAGGGLAIALTLWIRDQSSNIPQADGVVALHPWLDLTHSYPSFRINGKYDYLPASTEDPLHVIQRERTHYYTSSDDQLRDPLVSPVFAIDRNDKLLPPMLIHIGEKERLRDESLAFGEFQKSSAIRIEVFQDMPHVFQSFQGNIMAQRSLRRAGEYIKNIITRSVQELHVPIDPVNDPITSRTFVSISHDGSIKSISPFQIIESGHLELEKSQYAKQGLSNGLNGIGGRGLGSKCRNHGLAMFRAF